MSREASIDAARARLQSVSDQLSAYLAGSERVFLETGDHLREMQARARLLVEASGTAAAAAAREGEGDPVQRLVHAVGLLQGDIERSEAALRSGAEGLTRVLQGVDQLGPFASEFQRIGLTLWTLSIGTRIEDARTGADGGGFETVAGDVRRLGGLIAPKFESVLSRARVVRATAEAALARADAFLGRDAGRLARHLHATRDNLSALSALRAAAKALGGRTSAASAELSRSVDGILTVLQMHDVARQRMEHVCEALREQTGVESGSSTRDQLADVAVVSQLQKAQLGHARETLAKALEELAAHLGRIGSAAGGLASDTRKLAEVRGGRSVIETLDRGFSEASRALQEQLDQELAAASAMQRVTAAMKDLTAFAREIERIGGEVKLIALNAQVQAEKTGDGGRPLSVLARAIRELSVEVEAQTAGISEIMANIAGEAGGLRADTARDRAAEAVVSDMSTLLSSLHVQQQEICDAVEVLARDGATLRDDVTRLEGHLAAHGRAVRAVRDLEATLAVVSKEAAALAGPEASRAARARLGERRARYTMEGERATHRSVTRTAAAPAPDLRPAAATIHHGLGDNVELF